MKLYSALMLGLLAQGLQAQTLPPDIKRFEPSTGTTGTQVLILGKNFKSATKVRFGSVLAASFTIVNDSLIKATVGTGASGVIQVNNPGGEDTLGYFTFVQQQVAKPEITAFSPKSGPTGTTVKISGKNLRAVKAVKFGGVAAASFVVENDSTIMAKVGAGATGLVMVQVEGLVASLGTFEFIKPADTGCDAIRAFQPIINEIRTDIHCFRDSMIKVRVSNGEFRSYKWSNGDTTPYTYVRSSQLLSVQVGNTALGCFSKTATVKFVKNSRPPSEIVYKDSTLRVRPPAPYTRWYVNGELFSTDSVLRTRKIGVYSVETSDDKTCWTPGVRKFELSVGTLVRPTDSLFMKLYPNPSTGPFSVAIVLPTVRTVKILITITNASGSVVYKSPQLSLTGRELHIPLQISQKGVYRVEAKVNEKTITKTLFIQ
jgi:IPT/TIG domain/Secretion system C-terminal sorting domain